MALLADSDQVYDQETFQEFSMADRVASSVIAKLVKQVVNLILIACIRHNQSGDVETW